MVASEWAAVEPAAWRNPESHCISLGWRLCFAWADMLPALVVWMEAAASPSCELLFVAVVVRMSLCGRLWRPATRPSL